MDHQVMSQQNYHYGRCNSSKSTTSTVDSRPSSIKDFTRLFTSLESQLDNRERETLQEQLLVIYERFDHQSSLDKRARRHSIGSSLPSKDKSWQKKFRLVSLSSLDEDSKYNEPSDNEHNSFSSLSSSFSNSSHRPLSKYETDIFETENIVEQVTPVSETCPLLTTPSLEDSLLSTLYIVPNLSSFYEPHEAELVLGTGVGINVSITSVKRLLMDSSDLVVPDFVCISKRSSSPTHLSNIL